MAGDPSRSFHITRPILLFLSGAIALFLMLFLLSVYGTYVYQGQEAVKRSRAQFQNLFSSARLQKSLEIETILTTVSLVERYRTLFVHDDRAGLLAAVMPLNRRIRNDLGITHFYFHDPQGKNFLRVHEPTRHGDRIERATLRQAQRNGAVAAGVELGPLGTLTLRVVLPWRDGERLLGYLEMGSEISTVLSHIASATGMHFVTILDKANLNAAAWQSGMAMLQRGGRWDRFPHHAVAGATLDPLPAALTALLDDDGSALRTSAWEIGIVGSRLGEHDGLFISPLVEFQGRHIGHIVGILDGSQPRAALLEHLWLVVTACLLVGGLLMGVFHRFLRRVERRLQRTHQALQTSRTRQAEKTLREKETQLLYQTTSRRLLELATQPLTIPALLERFLAVMQTVPWLAAGGGSAAFLVEATSGELALGACRPRDGEGAFHTPRLPPDRCPCGEPVADQPAFHGDWRHGGPHGAVPVHAGDRLLGCLFLPLQDGHQPTDEDERLLAAAADTLAGIIQRRLTEDELHRLSHRNALLLDAMGEGVYGVDDRNRCIFINRAAVEMLGYPAETLLGQEIHAFIHHTRADGRPYPASECMVHDVARTGAGSRVDNELFWHADGASFPVRYSSHPIRDGGAVIGAVVVFQDISERLRMEARNRRLHQSTRAINRLLHKTLHSATLTDCLTLALDLTLEGGWVVSDNKGSIFLADAASGDLLLAVEKNLSQPIQERCRRVPSGMCLCGRAAAERQTIFASHVDDRHEIGYPGIPAHGHYCVPIHQGEQVLGVINLYTPPGHRRDIDEEYFLRAMADALAGIIGRFRSEERLQEQTVQLIHSGRLTAIGEMATGIAHEINQPLTYISGCFQSLGMDLDQGHVDTQKWRPKVEKAQSKVERIGQIIRHVRIFGSRDESHQGDGGSPACRVHAVLADALLLFGRKLEHADVALETDVDPALAAVAISANQLEQILVNLLQNALHALAGTGRGGRIAIGAGAEPETGELSIRFADDGPGMSDAVRQRIFEPFFTTKPVGEGTGLGLSIIHGIIHARGGRIECASTEGRGTVFTITLPRAAERQGRRGENS